MCAPVCKENWRLSREGGKVENWYGKLKGKNYAVFGGIVWLAMPAYKGRKGRRVIPYAGSERHEFTDAEVRAAFVAKNGGRFIKNRWYPEEQRNG
jgi:hypothetical protein